MKAAEQSTLIFLVDELQLRRASFVSLLEEWAGSAQLELIEVAHPADLCLPEHEDCRLCILSVGGTPLDEPEAAARLSLLRRLYPDRPLVVLTDLEDEDEVRRAYEAGASGYVPTGMPTSVALAALSFILAGGSYFPPPPVGRPRPAIGPPPDLTPRIEAPREDEPNDGDAPAGAMERTMRGVANGAASANAARDPGPSLTDRQGEVLDLVCRGRSNKEIARALGLSEATVKIHMRQLMRKLGAVNCTQVAMHAGRAHAGLGEVVAAAVAARPELAGVETAAAAAPHPMTQPERQAPARPLETISLQGFVERERCRGPSGWLAVVLAILAY